MIQPGKIEVNRTHLLWSWKVKISKQVHPSQDLTAVSSSSDTNKIPLGEASESDPTHTSGGRRWWIREKGEVVAGVETLDKSDDCHPPTRTQNLL